MLVKVSVENFKSFDGLTELTMIPSNKTRKNNEHKIILKSTPLLKSAVVYGANASGKSNLIDVFRFFEMCVKNGLPMESMKMFCKNKEENKEKSSTFELQITIGNKFYAYGFSAVLSKRKIVSEWLYELFQNGSAKRIFEREGGKKPELDGSIVLSKAEQTKFSIYADDFAENQSSLFLTEMNRNKKIDKKSKLFYFKSVYEWITKNIIILSPDMPVTNFEYYYNDQSLALVNKLIETFDTGISQIKIEEITLDELSKYLPKPIFDNVMNDLKSKVQEEDSMGIRLSMRSQDSFFNIEFTGALEPKITTIRLRHGKSFFDFDFEDESDGTRRLFDLMDLLLNKNDDTVYIIDELERSLHPKLTFHFIELFMKLHENQNVQLMFTTHESSIMDQSLFRRDEIWFVERDGSNASIIYSLDKFKERYDKKLSKAYLEGRYGAIPVFSSFEFGKEE